ncbi:uncharacterized protein LOC115236842 isoform X2 [Formica exsecta]|uniref:uncharacterized protein LOC115236842 isoform X2 n=1 Tax=Formica exsecta TaxID=72781 RepID=UPI001143BE4D|nr:uncharacterized protein LOC115236842 isoform X2 [Formica exsecta]
MKNEVREHRRQDPQTFDEEVARSPQSTLCHTFGSISNDATRLFEEALLDVAADLHCHRSIVYHGRSWQIYGLSGSYSRQGECSLMEDHRKEKFFRTGFRFSNRK